MSADEELGYVYLPVSTPTNDYYGGHRLGDGLYGESLVCLDAATGKKVWHYQLVHHGLWDYDLPAAPNLIDITVDGKAGQGGCAGDQAGLHLRIRSRHRPAGVADRGAAGAGLQRARRERIEDPAISDQAGADRHPGRDATKILIDFTPELRQGGDRHRRRNMIAAALYTPPTERGTIQVPGNGRRRKLGGRCDRSGNRHALCRHATGCRFVGHCPQAGAVGVAVRLHRRIPLRAGAARLAAAQAAIRQHGRDRHEQRRASLADSGRAQRGVAANPEARHPRATGIARHAVGR